MNQIDPETFTHLVGLAALDMDAAEAEYLRAELNHQLRVIAELTAIPLDESVEIASHGVPFPPEHRSPLRMDESMATENPDAITKQAPESEDGFLVVPDIPHTTLD